MRDDVPLNLTVNQVVAYNLKRARETRAWTQEEAANRLQPYLGVRWSKQTFSTAERSIESKVPREFTADEIVALALAFDVPISYFLTPPPWQPRISTRPPVWAPDHWDGSNEDEIVWRGFRGPKSVPEGNTRVIRYWVGTIQSAELLDLISGSESFQMVAQLRALADEIEKGAR